MNHGPRQSPSVPPESADNRASPSAAPMAVIDLAVGPVQPVPPSSTRGRDRRRGNGSGRGRSGPGVLSGDAGALTALLRANDERMRAVAWRMLGDADLVDDALQEAYLKAHRGLDRFRGEAQFATWLHRIVVNTCVDQLRRAAARNEVSIETEAELAVPEGTERIHQVERIRQALLALPFEQRVAVLLVDCDGYSYEQAAEVLGISETAVASRLFRARARLLRMSDDGDQADGQPGGEGDD